jgi:hypothetical protein
VSEFGGTCWCRVVRFSSLASGFLIGRTAHIFPIGVGLTLANKVCKHDMYETYVSCFWLKGEAADDMPSRMAVVAFSSFARSDGGFDLQSGQQRAAVSLAYQVGIPL